MSTRNAAETSTRKTSSQKVLSDLTHEMMPDVRFIQEAIRDGRATLQDVSLKAIGKPDTSLQARVQHIDMNHVKDLDIDFQVQGQLAPVVIFRDPETEKLWLADGFHRHEVYRRAGKASIPAYVIKGGHHEALLFATTCNRKKCLPRKIDDIYKGLDMMFDDPECWKWSDKRIADHVGINPFTVKRRRQFFALSHEVEIPQEVETADGRTQPYKNSRTTKIPKITAKDHGYECHHKGKKQFLGSTPAQAANRLSEILEEGEGRRVGLNLENLTRFLLDKGVLVEPGNTKYVAPGVRGLKTRTAVITSTEFQTADELPWVVGCLRLLRLFAGMPDARMVVACYPEDGRLKLGIEMARKDGVEFLTPEEIAESLNPTGGTNP